MEAELPRVQLLKTAGKALMLLGQVNALDRRQSGIAQPSAASIGSMRRLTALDRSRSIGRLRAIATSYVIGLARPGSKLAALRHTVTRTSCSRFPASLLSFKKRRQTQKASPRCLGRPSARSPAATHTRAAARWLRNTSESISWCLAEQASFQCHTRCIGAPHRAAREECVAYLGAATIPAEADRLGPARDRGNFMRVTRASVAHICGSCLCEQEARCLRRPVASVFRAILNKLA
jgi:hypothetical protein